MADKFLDKIILKSTTTVLFQFHGQDCVKENNLKISIQSQFLVNNSVFNTQDKDNLRIY